MTKSAHPKPRAPAGMGPESSYTLTFDSDFWHRVKVLATMRRQSLRELVRIVLREVVDEAEKTGELPRMKGDTAGGKSGKVVKR